MVFERSFDEVNERQHHFGQVGQVRPVAVAFGERQQRLGDPAGPGGGLGGHLKGPLHGLAVAVGQGEVHERRHAAQDVVEVVGDPAGQCAQGGHLLGLDKPLVELLAARLIHDPGRDAPAPAVGIRNRRERHHQVSQLVV